MPIPNWVYAWKLQSFTVIKTERNSGQRKKRNRFGFGQSKRRQRTDLIVSSYTRPTTLQHNHPSEINDHSIRKS